MQCFVCRLLFLVVVSPAAFAQSPTDKPAPISVGSASLSVEQKEAITKRYEMVLKALPVPSKELSVGVDVHSRRADALFFLGRFKESVVDYRAMVDLNPRLDESHWRLGIALFFAGKPKQAVAQFEKYHSYDDVDRENGIWRYLSQCKATDAKTAAGELIRYAKDDREPFPAVYKLFDGSMSPDDALNSIPGDLSATERDKRLFYTELYIGMHCVVKGQLGLAEKYLAKSVSRQWPRKAGFGPEYMWHVGRVQLDLLQSAKKRPSPKLQSK